MRPWFNRFGILIVTIMLLCVFGCGFKLRGTIEIPDYLRTVYITPNEPYEPFQRELRNRLTRYNVKIINRPLDDVTVLELSSPEITEQILAYNTSGQVQRSKLSYSLKYSLATKNPDDSRPQRTITRNREMTKTNNELLTNESEEQIVRKELLNETVSELLRQITTRPLHKEPVLDSSAIDDNPC